MTHGVREDVVHYVAEHPRLLLDCSLPFRLDRLRNLFQDFS
jgi:hypothetical protein